MIMTTPAKLEKTGLQMEEHYASKIPYSYLLNAETVETKSGHLMQTIKINGLFSETFDDELIDHEKHIRNTLLISLADSSTSLYFHTIRKRERRVLDGNYDNEFAQQLHQKWQHKLSQKQFFVNEHYITVVKKSPVGKIRRFSDLLSSFSSKIDGVTRQIYRDKALHDLNKITKRILTSLAHYEARKLTTYPCKHTNQPVSEVLSFLSRLINLSDRDIMPPQSDLSAYLPYKRLFFDKTTGTIAIRNIQNQPTYAGILSIKDYVGTSRAGFLDNLLDIQAEMVITQSFSFFDKNDARGKIKEQARNQSQSDDGDTTENLKIDQTLDELGSGMAVTGEHHFSILCQADSIQALEENIAVIDSALNQTGIIAIREDKGIKPAFFAMLPANHAYIVRRAPISSKNMASYASLHNYSVGKFSGNHWGEAVTILETISGTPYYFNFHILDVANTVIIGPQGSGKTLLESFLLALSMKFGGRLILFDIDETLKAFTLVMNGVYSTLSVGQRTGFAPFQMEDTEENRHFLTNLLRKIATINGQILSDEDDQRLKAAVDGAYQLKPQDRILRNIVPFLGMRKAGSLRMRFESWVGEGDYAWVFDNEIDSLSLNADIIGFDMTTILADPVACLPVYYYLFHRLDKLLDGTRTRIVVAEGWRALQDDVFQEKIKEWSSTPRKKEGFLVLDTQSPEDISQSPVGRKIIQESVTQIYFSNPKASYEDYVINFGLTEKEFEIIKTLEKSSRFFLLKQGKNSVVVRLDLSGFEDEITVLSTRKEYRDILNEVLNACGSKPRDWLPIYYQKIKQLAVNRS